MTKEDININSNKEIDFPKEAKYNVLYTLTYNQGQYLRFHKSLSNCQLCILDFVADTIEIHGYDIFDQVLKFMEVPMYYVHVVRPKIAKTIKERYKILAYNEILAQNGNLQYHIIFELK